MVPARTSGELFATGESNRRQRTRDVRREMSPCRDREA
jgi:hypothetical protein